MSGKKLTQKVRAAQCVAQMLTNKLAGRNLSDIIADAQNRPPEGEADGSISEDLWNALKKLHKAHVDFADAMDEVRDML